GFGRQHGGHAGHAGDLLHHLLGRLAQRLELLGSLERYGDREIDAPVLDEDLRNEAQIDDIAFEIRSLYPPELLQHLILRHGHALSPSTLVAGVDHPPRPNSFNPSSTRQLSRWKSLNAPAIHASAGTQHGMNYICRRCER